MQVTFKTITQEQFQLDLSADSSILDVKRAIADAKGEDFAVDYQKLIYNGKVLADESNFNEIGYDEKKFIVLIVKKPLNPAPRAPAKVEDTPSVEPEKEEAPKVKEGPSPASSVPSSTPSRPATDTSATPIAQPPAQSDEAPQRPIALSPENQEKLNSLIAMGYDEEQASAALRAAFFNVERAVEYLLTGIPDNVVPMELDEPSSEEQSPAGLDFLNDNEQFAQLRSLVRENPEMLPQIIQQIAADNPQLMQLIRDNEEQFLRILNGGDETEEDNDENTGAIPAAVVADAEANMANALQLTDADRAAISRLKDMGFPHNLVVEAYLACDKNEGLAVNYILQRMEEAYAERDRLPQ